MPSVPSSRTASRSGGARVRGCCLVAAAGLVVALVGCRTSDPELQSAVLTDSPPWTSARGPALAHALFTVDEAPTFEVAVAACRDGEALAKAVQRVLGPPLIRQQASVSLLAGSGDSWGGRLPVHARSSSSVRQLGCGSRQIRVASGYEYGGTPAEVLRHELAHWLLRVRSPIAVPPELRRELGDDPLSGVPWWLDEGFACVYEVGLAPDGGCLDNPARRADLSRWTVRGRRHAPPAAALQANRLQAHGAAHFAVAWALTRALLEQHNGADGDLRRYIDLFRRKRQEQLSEIWAYDPQAPGRTPRAKLAQWYSRESEISLECFQRVFVPAGATFDDVVDGLLAAAADQ